MGALGTTPKKLKQLLSDIGIEIKNSGIAENYHLIFCKDPAKFEEFCSYRTSRNLTTDLRPIQSATPTQ